jgi:Arc/MetJ-type ribon-helix-helix transcriptional regulator
MASQPHPNTMTVSFTLPRQLAAAVDAHAAAKLTNKSDIIRRALLDYLGPQEAARIMDSVLRERAGDESTEANDKPTTPVAYPKPNRNRKS